MSLKLAFVAAGSVTPKAYKWNGVGCHTFTSAKISQAGVIYESLFHTTKKAIEHVLHGY